MADEQHLDILRHGVDTWNRWRQEHPEILPDLCNAPLMGAKLNGIDFSRADLSGASLMYARLHKARLCWTDLQGANMHGADLSDSDLEGANLNGARLQCANLDNVHYIGLLSGKVVLNGKGID